MPGRFASVLVGFSLFVACGAAAADGSAAGERFACGFLPVESWRQELLDAQQRGEIGDPSKRPIPEISRRTHDASPVVPQCMTPGQIFPFEDTNQLLLTDFSTGQLLDLMFEAANQLMAAHGDNFDFVGYFLNFVPDHQIGGAFYASVENDVSGIGLDAFNERPAQGIGGEHLEGVVMMWNVNATWQPGAGPGASFTRLVLGQEFGHRFGMFLPDLADGRRLQGISGCGRGSHWNWRVDGQGSSMEISEWAGDSPAQPSGTFVNFNLDVGGVFSYPDLYLMGYVSPGEMDAGQSEFRYMDTSDCSSDYDGVISSVSSSDIITTAGPRVPDSSASQKHFRTGWIMLHLPGAPPTEAELLKAAGILEQHTEDWAFGTLGRGTMTNTLFDDCNCNGVADADDLLAGTGSDVDSNGILDECQTPCSDPSDLDGDGVGDSCDNCVAVPNANQNDGDADGIGDACDNCKDEFNPRQTDLNADFQGDFCDVDDGVIYQRFSGAIDLTWDEEGDFTSWNVYRGDLELMKATLRYSQLPGSTPQAAQWCGLAGEQHQDAFVPAAGAVAFYLIAGESGGVEGDLGTNSAGDLRSHNFPCP